MADETDRTVAATRAAGLLAREASNAWAGDEDRIPHRERADHAVKIYEACLHRLKHDKGST
jgi:hypothetical protein